MCYLKQCLVGMITTVVLTTERNTHCSVGIAILFQEVLRIREEKFTQKWKLYKVIKW